MTSSLLTAPQLWQPYSSCWTSWPAPRQAALLARLSWLTAARANQLPPATNWHCWLLLAGRGFGKTRAGAEEFIWQLLRHDGWRGAIVAPTMSDARDTCVEGESGILSLLPSACVSNWNRSQAELMLFNGSRIKLFSADAAERLRGPQHHVAWGDEVAAWSDTQALDQLRFGLRLGQNPKLILTTTPKPLDLLRDLLRRDGQGVAVTRGHTFENAANLAPAALAELRTRYEGTRLGRQELYADVIDEVAGALWSYESIGRVSTAPALQRIVIAVDPAVTSGEKADHTGIIAAGLGADEKVYVLADRSCQLSPDAWARRVIALYDELQADLVIGEVNQGGDLVETLLRSIAPQLPYKAVRANRGKVLRAEPVAALYEQQLVYHVGQLSALEAEMTRFAPGALVASPDRVDALVWAVTELKLNKSNPRLRHL